MDIKTREETKVVFIAHVSNIGGAEKSMIELIKGLTRKNISCHVILPEDGLLAAELRKISVPIHVVYLPWCADAKNLYLPQRVTEIQKSVLEVVAVLQQVKPDVVYSNASVIFQGAIASTMLGLKHIWHIREFGEDDFGIHFYLPLKERAEFVQAHSDKVIFISQALMKIYEKYIPNAKLELIYNEVEVPSLHRLNVKNDERYRLNLLIIGNVHPAKGQFDAVRALKILHDKGIVDIKLRIVGNKEVVYLESILKYIREHDLTSQVEWFDFTPTPLDFYQSSDVVLMCSRSEGFGRVTVESMLLERPVIGANAGGTAEIIKDMESGLLYEPGDVQDLAEKILFFYKDKNKIAQLGKRGKILCEEKFAKGRYVQRIYEIIMDLKAARKEVVENLFSAVFDETQFVKKCIMDERDTALRARDATQAELKEVKHELKNRGSQLKEIELQLNLKNTELRDVYSSRLWRLSTIIRNLMDDVAPRGSRRRDAIYWSWDIAKRVRGSYIFLLLRVRKWWTRKKSNRRRKINLKSRKVAIICHSYHKKTRSSEFFINLLKKFFEVEVLWDESAYGKPFTDVSCIDGSYLAVIFWQNLPNREIIEAVKNKSDNIIFVPMYDAVGKVDYCFIQYCYDFKIISFSKTLHDLFTASKLKSLSVKYFPELRPYIPGNKNKVFFWQRTSHIHIHTVGKLLENTNASIHVHKAIDPYHEFVPATKEEEDRFHITYSDWFGDKEAMLEIVKEAGIYIAPRKAEGIGMSFLEAMAMGKAVVACDNPTMNEYIEDGRTGYLFNPSKPRPIDFSGIERIQKNTYTYMRDGLKQWEKDKRKIIEFIKQP